MKHIKNYLNHSPLVNKNSYHLRNILLAIWYLLLRSVTPDLLDRYMKALFRYRIPTFTKCITFSLSEINRRKKKLKLN